MSQSTADCSWCPLCQAMARLRESRPDLADQLTATSAALTSAVGTLLRDLLPPDPPAGASADAAAGRAGATGAAGSAGPAAERPTGAPPRPPLERIDIVE